MEFITVGLQAIGGGSVLSGAFTAASAFGSIYSGMQAGAEADAASQVAARNAENARLVANAREEQVRRRSKFALGEQRAAAASSGFDPSSGSMLDLQGDSAGQLELDALNTRYEGTLTALSFENEAAAMKRRARSSRTGGYLNAAGTLLGGLGRTYGQQRIGPPAPVSDLSFRPVYSTPYRGYQ
jgi:hypothetical protein